MWGTVEEEEADVEEEEDAVEEVDVVGAATRIWQHVNHTFSILDERCTNADLFARDMILETHNVLGLTQQDYMDMFLELMDRDGGWKSPPNRLQTHSVMSDKVFGYLVTGGRCVGGNINLTKAPHFVRSRSGLDAFEVSTLLTWGETFGYYVENEWTLKLIGETCSSYDSVDPLKKAAVLEELRIY